MFSERRGDVMGKNKSREAGVIEKEGVYWLDYRVNGKRIRTKVGPQKSSPKM